MDRVRPGDDVVMSGSPCGQQDEAKTPLRPLAGLVRKASGSSHGEAVAELNAPSCAPGAFVIKSSGRHRRVVSTEEEDTGFLHWPHLSIARVCTISASMDVALAVFTYPLWHLKTRSQATDAASTLQAARSVTQRHGLRGLYRGCILGTLGLAPAHSVYVCTYEWAKYRFSTCCPTWLAPGLAALVGDCIYCALALPVEVLTVRRQIAALGTPLRALFVDVRCLWAQGGLASFYRGGLLSLAQTLPESTLWWMVYEQSKANLLGLGASQLMAMSGSAIMASVVSAAATNPVDVMKTRVQSGQVMLQRGQPLGCLFARGLIPRLAAAMLIGQTESYTYEAAMHYGRRRDAV